MDSSDFRAHTEPLFKKFGILKFNDMIHLQNCLFVHDFFKGNLPSTFINTFIKLGSRYNYLTRNNHYGMLRIPSYKTTNFGFKSIFNKCNISWNNVCKKLNAPRAENVPYNANSNKPIDLTAMSRFRLKTSIINLLLNSYQD